MKLQFMHQAFQADAAKAWSMQAAEQGSRQLQGEIIELDAEQNLRAAFPIAPPKKPLKISGL